MARRWTESVSDALRRVAARHGTHIIGRDQLIAEELRTIVSETDSRGRTPQQTLSRILQELRDEGLLTFDGPGVYRLVDTSPEGKATVPQDGEAASPAATKRPFHISLAHASRGANACDAGSRTSLSDQPIGGQMPGGARDEDFDDRDGRNRRHGDPEP
jgi:hypothetical protein